MAALEVLRGLPFANLSFPACGRRFPSAMLPSQLPSRLRINRINRASGMTEAGKGKNRSLALLGMITERNSGDQALRWTATGLLEEERKFRKVEGFRDLATL